MDYPYLQALQQELHHKGSVSMTVSVHPNARVTGVQTIFENNVVKINIAKPADQGKANQELIRFVAELFGVPQLCVDIITGHHARIKRLTITQVS